MSNKVLEIVIKARDEATKTLNGLSDTLKKNEQSFKKMAVGGTVAFTGITTAIALSVKEANKDQQALTRLTHILKTATGATDEQIKSLKKQADALERVGVVGADATMTAQGQLATFDLQAESIEKLIPSILDYAVAEKGASVSSEELKSMTNGLAQALQGNFGSLTRTGFVLDENTKALIANGTETQRVEALVSVLNSTYSGMNETMKQTAEGGMIALKNQFDGLLSTIGTQFLPLIVQLTEKLTPVIEKVTAWVEANPELTRNIILASAAIAGIIALIGILGLVLPAVITGFTLLAGPIGVVIGILAGLVIAVKNVSQIMYMLQNELPLIWDGIKITFKEGIDNLISMFDPLFKTIDKVKNAVSNIGSGIKSSVSGAISKVKDKISGKAVGGGVQVGNSYLVGEKGPEMFTPANNGSIVPNYKLAGSGGMNLTININGGTYLDDNVAEKLGDRIIQNFKLISKF
jgi:hypothetical protein